MANILKYIKVDMKSTLESGVVLLIEKPRAYESWNEGIKTGLEGLAYPCLCEGLNFEKLTVKIAGTTVSPIEYKGEPIAVVFEGLEGKLWQDFKNGGEVKLSVTARNIAPAEEKRLKMSRENKV